MFLIPIPAFADNYLWLLHDGKRALVVDPGDAEPVLRTLEQHALQLESILVTHHHADHTGGVNALREQDQPTLPTSIAQELLLTPFNAPGKLLSWRLPAALMRRPMTTTPYLPPSGSGKTNSNDASLPNRCCL